MIKVADVSEQIRRWGQLSAYYFLDNYRLDNPIPDARRRQRSGVRCIDYMGKRSFQLGGSRNIGSRNSERVPYRSDTERERIGEPHGGLGVSLTSQGFVTGAWNTRNHGAGPPVRRRGKHRFPSHSSWECRSPMKSVEQHALSERFLSKVIGAHTLNSAGSSARIR